MEPSEHRLSHRSWELSCGCLQVRKDGRGAAGSLSPDPLGFTHRRDLGMRVFVTGATGALGSRLLPLLLAAGHSVVGVTHTSTNTRGLRAAGAEAVVADGLDAAA